MNSLMNAILVGKRIFRFRSRLWIDDLTRESSVSQPILVGEIVLVWVLKGLRQQRNSMRT